LKKHVFIFIFIVFASNLLLSQPVEKMQMNAFRISETIKIDGHLDEAVWEVNANPVPYVQREPNPSQPSKHPTSTIVLYDDNSVYVGAMMYDSAPDSILKELSDRDNIRNTDWFGFLFDTYNDGLNAPAFALTASGVQWDGRYSSDGLDDRWNSVWESAVSINEQGWVAEIRIPYSAIRFPKTDIQTWGINFVRVIRRYREESWWNEVNPKVDGTVNQSGLINGISEIKSPVRLSFTPYVSGYLEIFNNPALDVSKTTTSYNGGLDLKYGIDDAFTLDMTLIPDFGQVQSDNEILNLSPFETQFNERRQFFMEGTELFNRGGVFYSRRIGSVPIGFGTVGGQSHENETIVSNPQQSKLLNATKISGRNRNNLGIGIFNAVEGNTFAIVENDEGKEREILTGPVTNYNMVVLDQAMKNNSYLSLFNTNVYRSGKTYDANVTGTEFSFRDKTNTYGFRGSLIASQKYGGSFDHPEVGFKYNIGIGKVSGNFQYEYWYYVADEKYDPNDMGFLHNNNKRNTGIKLKYNVFEPFGIINRMYSQLNFSYLRLVNPNSYTGYEVYGEQVITFNTFLTVGGWFEFSPDGYKDYFEPRTPGRFFDRPAAYFAGAWMSTDYRKKIALDIRTKFFPRSEAGNNGYGFGLEPRIRISDQLSFQYEIEWERNNGNVGYVDHLTDTILMGRRDITTFEQEFSAAFIFNNKMSVSLFVRHYWSTAQYTDFYELTNDGDLNEIEYNAENGLGQPKHDINFNAFTVDMTYRWEFAPGSEIRAVWKNSIFQNGNIIQTNYLDNWNAMASSPQTNSFSIKFLYYLDYLSFRKKSS